MNRMSFRAQGSHGTASNACRISWAGSIIGSWAWPNPNTRLRRSKRCQFATRRHQISKPRRDGLRSVPKSILGRHRGRPSEYGKRRPQTPSAFAGTGAVQYANYHFSHSLYKSAQANPCKCFRTSALARSLASPAFLAGGALRNYAGSHSFILCTRGPNPTAINEMGEFLEIACRAALDTL